MKQSLILALSIVCLAGMLQAQNVVVGRIDGTVTDPSGKTVGNALVTIADAERGTSTSLLTVDDGYYRILNLRPGRYTISASRAGFQQATRSDVTLTVNQAITVNLQLELEQFRQAVNVQASAVAVQAQSAETSTLITEKQIDLLPLNWQDWCIRRSAPWSRRAPFTRFVH